MQKLNGQLWEHCPLCGREPIYLSNGGYCEKHGTDWRPPVNQLKTEIYGDEYERGGDE